jgi:transmembrane 9 superfamily protein 2/4
VFLYSIVYFSRLESNMFVTYLLYFGYMGVISLGVFLVTGELLSPRLLVHLAPG